MYADKQVKIFYIADPFHSVQTVWCSEFLSVWDSPYSMHFNVEFPSWRLFRGITIRNYMNIYIPSQIDFELSHLNNLIFHNNFACIIVKFYLPRVLLPSDSDPQ